MIVARIGALYLIDLIWTGSGTPRVVVAGDIDEAGAAELRGHLAAALALNTTWVQVDLSAMATCHPDGAAALWWADRQARRRNCRLRTTGGHSAVLLGAPPPTPSDPHPGARLADDQLGELRT